MAFADWRNGRGGGERRGDRARRRTTKWLWLHIQAFSTYGTQTSKVWTANKICLLYTFMNGIDLRQRNMPHRNYGCDMEIFSAIQKVKYQFTWFEFLAVLFLNAQLSMSAACVRPCHQYSCVWTHSHGSNYTFATLTHISFRWRICPNQIRTPNRIYSRGANANEFIRCVSECE